MKLLREADDVDLSEDAGMSATSRSSYESPATPAAFGDLEALCADEDFSSPLAAIEAVLLREVQTRPGALNQGWLKRITARAGTRR